MGLDLDPTPFGLDDGVLAVAPASGMDTASPWWYVGRTSLASEANVEIVTYRVVLMGAADPLDLQADPVASLVPNNRLAITAAQGLVAAEAIQVSVLVPLLVNPRALAAGASLKRYVERQEVGTKAPQAITAAHVAKRAKRG